MAAKGGLGLGLGALFDDNTIDTSSSQMIRLSEIEPNRSQPRKNFDDSSISVLADSIKQHGVLQPLLVRPFGNGYQIVAGERRWRAARMLGLSEVPVQIKEMSDSEAMQLALIENLQRENLNPIEEAMGYSELIENYGMTQEDISKTVGRSRSAVANSLRLLNLPDEVQKMLEENELSVGHAKALLSFENEQEMIDAAKKACGGKMTVRSLEKLASSSEKPEKTDYNEKIDSYFKEMEIGLNEALGRRVKVEYGKNKGALILEFYDKEDLSALAERLTN
ncbi:MAG: ParB/RepB/Spo0J family partition protein [Clostridium sp.]|nr:ParB/RepB/Spo0J family partition protein [Clostridium sp.]MCM1547497.1 ParB/RepB/Spo0J family partition protein [Ruminococcus sp.]